MRRRKRSYFASSRNSIGGTISNSILSILRKVTLALCKKK